MPVLLDCFCGAGGATKGYQQADFYVVGVDVEPQPHYCGDEFVQADALDFLKGDLSRYDAIHASPPCQFASRMRNLPWLRGREYPELIKPVRDMLRAIGRPWVIENVYDARHGSKQLARLGLQEHGMQAGWLCGGMFGLPLFRHRLFETSFFWMQPAHPGHRFVLQKGRNFGSRGNVVERRMREATPWMTSEERHQAIPPAMTHYIGREMMRQCFGQEAR